MTISIWTSGTVLAWYWQHGTFYWNVTLIIIVRGGSFLSNNGAIVIIFGTIFHQFRQVIRMGISCFLLVSCIKPSKNNLKVQNIDKGSPWKRILSYDKNIILLARGESSYQLEDCDSRDSWVYGVTGLISSLLRNGLVQI